jgi:hypothetical protein
LRKECILQYGPTFCDSAFLGSAQFGAKVDVSRLLKKSLRICACMEHSTWKNTASTCAHYAFCLYTPDQAAYLCTSTLLQNIYTDKDCGGDCANTSASSIKLVMSPMSASALEGEAKADLAALQNGKEKSI